MCIRDRRIGAAPVARGQHQAAAGLEHPCRLGQQRHGVGHMFDHVPQRNHIEVIRRQRGLLQVARDDGQLQAIPRIGCTPGRKFHTLYLVVGSCLGQEEAGRAAHIQQAATTCDARRQVAQHSQFSPGVGAACRFLANVVSEDRIAAAGVVRLAIQRVEVDFCRVLADVNTAATGTAHHVVTVLVEQQRRAGLAAHRAIAVAHIRAWLNAATTRS